MWEPPRKDRTRSQPPPLPARLPLRGLTAGSRQVETVQAAQTASRSITSSPADEHSSRKPLSPLPFRHPNANDSPESSAEKFLHDLSQFAYTKPVSDGDEQCVSDFGNHTEIRYPDGSIKRRGPRIGLKSRSKKTRAPILAAVQERRTSKAPAKLSGEKTDSIKSLQEQAPPPPAALSQHQNLDPMSHFAQRKAGADFDEHDMAPPPPCENTPAQQQAVQHPRPSQDSRRDQGGAKSLSAEITGAKESSIPVDHIYLTINRGTPHERRVRCVPVNRANFDERQIQDQDFAERHESLPALRSHPVSGEKDPSLHCPHQAAYDCDPCKYLRGRQTDPKALNVRHSKSSKRKILPLNELQCPNNSIENEQQPSSAPTQRGTARIVYPLESLLASEIQARGRFPFPTGTIPVEIAGRSRYVLADRRRVSLTKHAQKPFEHYSDDAEGLDLDSRLKSVLSQRNRRNSPEKASVKSVSWDPAIIALGPESTTTPTKPAVQEIQDVEAKDCLLNFSPPKQYDQPKFDNLSSPAIVSSHCMPSPTSKGSTIVELPDTPPTNNLYEVLRPKRNDQEKLCMVSDPTIISRSPQPKPMTPEHKTVRPKQEWLSFKELVREVVELDTVDQNKLLEVLFVIITAGLDPFPASGIERPKYTPQTRKDGSLLRNCIHTAFAMKKNEREKLHKFLELTKVSDDPNGDPAMRIAAPLAKGMGSLNPTAPEFKGMAISQQNQFPNNIVDQQTWLRWVTAAVPEMTPEPFWSQLPPTVPVTPTIDRNPMDGPHLDDSNIYGREARLIDPAWANSLVGSFTNRYPLTGRPNGTPIDPVKGRQAAAIQQRLEYLLMQEKEKKALEGRVNRRKINNSSSGSSSLDSGCGISNEF